MFEEFEGNPFLPNFYKDPERHAFAVELSFLAQRYHQLKRVGERSLFQPMTVADHSIGKSLVFANVNLTADEDALFRDLYMIMYSGLPKPNLLVYLLVQIETARERIYSRGRSYEQGIQKDGARVLMVEVGGKDLLQDHMVYRHLLDLIVAERPIGLFVECL